MMHSDPFTKSFTEEELDQAESLIKRERPDLWRNLIQPNARQMQNNTFFKDFFQLVRKFGFINALTDVTALCYGLYERAGSK